jgi:hypothetical protein
MPDSVPEAQHSDDVATKPFAAWLQEQRQGGLHGEISDELRDLVAAVMEHEKQGTLTLKLTIKPAGDNAVFVVDEVKSKPPEGDRPAALFFTDGRGNLSRRDPRQPELPRSARSLAVLTTRPTRPGRQADPCPIPTRPPLRAAPSSRLPPPATPRR